MEFHEDGKFRDGLRRDRKERRVGDGTTHASLVLDGPRCIGWCQFGSPEELPRIKRKRAYEIVVNNRPDWRITCFFVDKDYRNRGVSALALAGALKLIAAKGGGTVESYPADADGRSVSASFLYNSRLTMFERQGFERVARLGRNHWVVSRTVTAKA